MCITDCQFCAFYRKPGDKEAYTLTVEEVMAKMEAAARGGATTVLLQGGHNPALPLDYYLTLVRETLRRFPGVTPHFFTASEIQTIAQVAGKPVDEIIALLKEAGLSHVARRRRRGAVRARARTGSSPRRAVPRPGSTFTARRTVRACGPLPP